MIDLAIISGSGFYDFPWLEKPKEKTTETSFGKASVWLGRVKQKRIAFIPRHRPGHTLLPNMINFRANLLALKELDVKAIVSTTVCGVLDVSLPLAKPIVFSDLYFPDNRLPDGEICSIFSEEDAPERGHFLFDRPFSDELRQQLIDASEDPIDDAVYAHVNGPRFNTKPEIRSLQRCASFISQTAGPEVILAGELEIPIALLGFGVDYANGVSDIPTPVEILRLNLVNSKGVFLSILEKLIENFKQPRFAGFIYRFD
ncbi:MAG: MTAP family purine nucleoside phosphorylase [Candidatus Aminicenantes bacterium]|jgi:5'-methylthioadenosine phosphorylase